MVAPGGAKGFFFVLYIPFAKMIADGMIKVLVGQAFAASRAQLGLEDITELVRLRRAEEASRPDIGSNDLWNEEI